MNALKLYHAFSGPVPIEDPDMIMVDYVVAFDGRNMPKMFNHVLWDKHGNLADVGERNTLHPAFDFRPRRRVIRYFSATGEAKSQKDRGKKQ